MGTNCIIARQNPGGTITAAYCALDGNPERTGRKLLEHYQDHNTLSKLLALDELYSLGNSPDDPLGYYEVNDPAIPLEKALQLLEDRCVTLPGPRRGAADPYNQTTTPELSTLLSSDGPPFAYLWTGGQWLLLQQPHYAPASLELHLSPNPK